MLRRKFFGFLMEDTLSLDHFNIVEYYPYTSIVTLRLVESDRDNDSHHNPFNEWLNKLWEEIEELLMNKYKIQPDNKVAVKLVPKESRLGTQMNYFFDSAIYIGYKDNVVSVGLGVWQPDNYTKEYNKTLR